MHFGIKSVAEVVAERRNVVQEKHTGRGASSRRFVQKIGEKRFFFCGRCNTGDGPFSKKAKKHNLMRLKTEQFHHRFFRTPVDTATLEVANRGSNLIY